MDHKFSEKDLRYISDHGQTPENIRLQLETFERGFGFLDIAAAATTRDGIINFTDVQQTDLAGLYDDSCRHLRTVKFIPASGAATRMFKNLFEAVDTGIINAEAGEVLDNIGEFAFAGKIDTSKGGMEAIKAILDYGADLPKALILFHDYADGPRTALEEHMAEAASYIACDGTARLHFTVSPEHRRSFCELVDTVKSLYEKKYGVRYEITFSTQKPSTDTIAATEYNRPFRDAEGNLVFRPAGHGALLDNLQDLEADAVFIKNIDNVTTDFLRKDTVHYKKIMGGLLIRLRDRIYEYTRLLEETEAADTARVRGFIEQWLGYRFPEGTAPDTEQLLGILRRPLRICAMVRNQGEPGGGPFWVRARDNSLSLQIAEPSQISPQQRNLLTGGTHFNPADLVCSLRDRHGNKYDLSRFRDPSTGFISDKSLGGKPLRAMELPGLWNGAMALWNTVFIEAPVSTFTPVKTVADLLRPEHRNKK